jgi:hypothetical protein
MSATQQTARSRFARVALMSVGATKSMIRIAIRTVKFR